MRHLYQLVMDPNVNPLSALPRMLRFQLMSVLSFMWSFVFATWIGLLAAFGPLVAVHMVLLVGIFFTSAVFLKAKEMQPLSYDMLFKDRRDGCARYDDVWGG